MGQQSLLTIDGSEPLSKPYQERCAQLRSLGLPALTAAREAARHVGRNADLVTPENARKLCQKQHIKDRAAWLARQEQAVIDEKRRMLEERQWLWHDADIAQFYTIIEEPRLDKNGDVIRDLDGNPLMRKVERLKPLSELPRELRMCVESVTYTDSGKPNLKLHSKADANRELRKINGIDVAKSVDGDEHSRMPDKEFFAELARQAAELGVNLKMTFEAMVE